jgi:hypothetical protein
LAQIIGQASWLSGFTFAFMPDLGQELAAIGQEQDVFTASVVKGALRQVKKANRLFCMTA